MWTRPTPQRHGPKCFPIVSIAMFLGFALCASPCWSEETESPVGTWKVVYSSGERAVGRYILRLDQHEGKLRGHLQDYNGSERVLQAVHFEDRFLSFESIRRWRGESMTAHYTGTLSKNEMTGTVEMTGGDRRVPLLTWKAKRTTETEVQPAAGPPPVAADIPLTDANFVAWRDNILPATVERAWEKIPWRTSFRDGILAADAAELPLLLWTMNGHPLGCT